MKPKPRTVEIVKSSYQPTKAELHEAIVMDGSMKETARCVLRSITPRWIKKPRNRR